MSQGNTIIANMTEQQAKEKLREVLPMLLECRDALPAISLAGAKLHNVDLTLADRIERALEPWRIPDEVHATK